MTRISAINRATHFRRGKGIARAYHNVENMSRMQTGFAGFELFLTAINAAQKNLFTSLILGGFTAFFAKRAIHYHNIKVDLWDSYQEIVDRAKKIYKNK